MKAAMAELGEPVVDVTVQAARIIGRRGVKFVRQEHKKHLFYDSPMNEDADGSETRSFGRRLRHLCYMKRAQGRLKKCR